MKRLTIIFFFFIIGYALYWCISDYDYRYNKINSIVGIYKLEAHPIYIGGSFLIL